MCILSGGAYILLFDGKYSLQQSRRGDEMLKIIAFNAENDLEIPPDKEYVRPLEHSFPGTAVSIRLNLNESYLAKLVSSNGEENGQKS